MLLVSIVVGLDVSGGAALTSNRYGELKTVDRGKFVKKRIKIIFD